MYKLLLMLFIPVCVFASDEAVIKIFGDKITETQAQNASNIYILDKKDIERIKPQTTKELLEKIPGVDIKSYDEKSVAINMGGFVGDKAGLNNVIMLNGRRINNTDMSGTDISTIPVDTIEKVEVYYGGNSVLFGDRAIGGVINIVTKKPTKDSFTIKGEGGSYDMYKAYAEAVLARENYSIILNGTRYSTDGYRDNAEFRYSTVSGEASYFNEKFEATVNGLYTDQKYGFPGGLTGQQMEQYGRRYSTTPSDEGHDFEWLSGVKLSYDTGKYGKFSFDSQYRKRHRDYELFGSNIDQLKTGLLSPKYELTISKGNYSNTLMTGVDVELYKSKTTYSGKMDRDIISYYIADNMKLGSFFTEMGVRHAELSDDYKTDDLSRDLSATAFTFTLGYNITPSNTVYTRADKSYRFPTTDEINEVMMHRINTDLKKQESYTYEIGYKYNLKSFYAGTSFYFQKSNNEIFTNPNYVPYFNTNFDTEKYVFNLNTGYDDGHILGRIAYNYIDSKITEKGYDHSRAPLVSKHNVKATVGYRTNFGLGAYYDVRYYSNFYPGNDYKNEYEKQSGYVVCDLKLDYTFKNFDIFFKVNNLFDKHYYDYVFPDYYYPSPGRNFAGGLSYRF